MKTQPKLVPVVASIPALGYAVLLAFAFVAMLELGHWPYYAHPDPKELDMPILFGAASIAFVASVVAATLIPLILGILALTRWERWKDRKRSVLLLACSLYVVGMALWIGDLSLGGFTNWLLD